MARTTAEFLKQAKRLIDTPSKWGKGKYYDIRDGKKCYCAMGAIMVTAPDSYAQKERALIALTAATGAPPRTIRFSSMASSGVIIAFNDDEKTTHKDVMDLFDRAIESCNA